MNTPTEAQMAALVQDLLQSPDCRFRGDQLQLMVMAFNWLESKKRPEAVPEEQEQKAG